MVIENIVNSPGEWNILPLGEICRVGGGEIQTGPFGSQLHAADYVETGIPAIMPKNILVERIDTEDIAYIADKDAKRLTKYLVQPGDIIYSRRGDVEKCALVTSKEEGWLCGTGCLRIRLGENSELSPEYLHAFLAHPSVREWVVRHAIGATMPNLNTSILGALPVPIPDEQIQNEIATIWRTSINKIELNRLMNRTLEEMAQAIFKSWFVDFEPVKAKAAAKAAGATSAAIERAAMAAIAGRSIEEAIAEEGFFDDLSPSNRESLTQTAALFPDAFQDSELGAIPERWHAKSMSDGTVFREGPGILAKDFHSDGIPLIRLAGLKSGVSLLDGCNYLDPIKVEKKWAHFRLIEGDILLSTSASLGRVAEVDKEAAGSIAYTGIIGFRSKEGKSTQRYIYHYLSSPLFQSQVEATGAGSVLKHFGPTHLKKMLVLLPSIESQARFSDLVSPLDEGREQCLRESTILAQLRDTLLPKLLSGELTISEVESQSEEALA